VSRRSRATRVEFAVPGGQGAPAKARRELTSKLTKHLEPRVMYEVSLLLSELVTNAVRHGGAGEGHRIGVEVRLIADRIRVSVTDPGKGFDRPATPRAHAGGQGGNGLPLLQALASDWDVERGKGTRVWFEMAVERAA
jgi:anti-sigma regulatory factor (Ser/Thr protein kinase)